MRDVLISVKLGQELERIGGNTKRTMQSPSNKPEFVSAYSS